MHSFQGRPGTEVCMNVKLASRAAYGDPDNDDADTPAVGAGVIASFIE